MLTLSCNECSPALRRGIGGKGPSHREAIRFDPDWPSTAARGWPACLGRLRWWRRWHAGGASVRSRHFQREFASGLHHKAGTRHANADASGPASPLSRGIWPQKSCRPMAPPEVGSFCYPAAPQWIESISRSPRVSGSTRNKTEQRAPTRSSSLPSRRPLSVAAQRHLTSKRIDSASGSPRSNANSIGRCNNSPEHFSPRLRVGRLPGSLVQSSIAPDTGDRECRSAS